VSNSILFWSLADLQLKISEQFDPVLVISRLSQFGQAFQKQWP